MIYVIDYEDYDFFASFAETFANFAVKKIFFSEPRFSRHVLNVVNVLKDYQE